MDEILAHHACFNVHFHFTFDSCALHNIISGVGSGVAPGARAPPCWIVLESFHNRETCFAGRIFRAWSGGPSPAESPRGIVRAWLPEAGPCFRSANAPGVMLHPEETHSSWQHCV